MLHKVLKTRPSGIALQVEMQNHSQVQPPGMNIIYLPFADDLRSPEEDVSFIGPGPYPSPGKDQVEAAGKLLKKLHLHDFQPGMVSNPHLQRHYQVMLKSDLN